MREMKDSGIEWIGKISAHWEVTKLKTNFAYEKGKNAALYTKEYVGLHKGSYPVYSGQTEDNGIMGTIDTFDYDLEECVFSTTVGAKVMTPMYLSGKFSLSQNCLIMKPIGTYLCKMLYYCLEPLFDYERKLIPSYMQPSLRFSDLNKYCLPQPPISEQQAIADYLDKECARIDGIVTTQRQIIERLKEYKKSVITEAVTCGLNPDAPMKDSGIDWIGRIPASWEAQRIKSAFEFFKGLPITKENLKESGLAVLSYGQVHAKNNDFVSIKEHLLRFVDEDYKKYSQSKVNKFDFVFADTSEDLDGCGNCCYKRDDSELYAGYHTLVLRSKHKKDNRFFAYLFTTDIWRQQIRTKVSGVKLFSVTQRILSQTSIIIPSDKEQKEIADYLDRKCSEIDSIIEKRERMIELMTEYKKSLIYECVTGKKEIVDVVE